MREDFAKILVERPRTGRAFAELSKDRGQIRARQKADLAEELPDRESVRNKRGRLQTKEFGENLAPLYRFIDKQVGRPWNKVYAEVCAQVDRANPVQAHIFLHLFDRIEKNPVYAGGKVLWNSRFFSGDEIPRNAYYIDQRGILRRGKGETYRDRTRRSRASEVASFIAISLEKVAKQDEQGLWYEVTLAPLTGLIFPVRDVWLKRDLYGGDGSLAEYGQKGVYAVAKRAMNTREIAELTGR